MGYVFKRDGLSRDSLDLLTQRKRSLPCSKVKGARLELVKSARSIT